MHEMCALCVIVAFASVHTSVSSLWKEALPFVAFRRFVFVGAAQRQAITLRLMLSRLDVIRLRRMIMPVLLIPAGLHCPGSRRKQPSNLPVAVRAGGMRIHAARLLSARREDWQD
jgi:hypothetical protein